MTTVAPPDSETAIRQATRADLLDVFGIEKQVFDQPWPYSAFERQVGTPAFLVSETGGPVAADGELTGFVVADTIPNHRQPLGHVKDIAVRPDSRGEGIGAALLQRSLVALGRQGVRSVKLEVRRSNDPAMNLYENHGFEYLRTLPQYYSDGEDAYVLVANLEDRDAF
ncbi:MULTISPECIES: GNAT family N-acetyltransferase [Halobacterium]|uniref:GNAT family N-acetyltransferase n=1 Tax=Halobacterium TaxID=2239 RepID=UPI00073F951D|nr:GNAT family N-acetyltransferase [Halobacterium sp. CBA1132]MCG1001929.1 GNAT family N-acetyltransferase [Halobacterium noricense]